MTKADAIAAIKTTTQGALTASDINGLEGCTDEQLTYILQGWKNIAKVKGEERRSTDIDNYGSSAGMGAIGGANR